MRCRPSGLSSFQPGERRCSVKCVRVSRYIPTWICPRAGRRREMDRGARSGPVYARARIWEHIDDRGCDPGKCDDLHGHGSLLVCPSPPSPSLRSTHTRTNPMAEEHFCSAWPEPAQLPSTEGRGLGLNVRCITNKSSIHLALLGRVWKYRVHDDGAINWDTKAVLLLLLPLSPPRSMCVGVPGRGVYGGRSSMLRTS